MELSQKDQIKICRIFGMEPDGAYRATFKSVNDDLFIHAFSPDNTQWIRLRIRNDANVFFASRLKGEVTNVFIDQRQRVYSMNSLSGGKGVHTTVPLANDFITYKYRRQTGSVIKVLSKLSGELDKHPLLRFAAKVPGEVSKKDVKGYLVCELKHARSAGVGEILGIQKPVTVENWLDHGARAVIVKAGDLTFAIKESRGGFISCDRLSGSRTENYEHIYINDRIRTAGGPFGTLMKRVFEEVDIQAGKLALPETDILDAHSDVFTESTKRDEGIVTGIDSGKETFDTTQPEARHILYWLGLAMPADFIEHGKIVFEATDHGYHLTAESPKTDKDTPPEQAEVDVAFSGKTEIKTIKPDGTPDGKVEKHEAPPQQFNEKTKGIRAELLLNLSPLKPKATANEVNQVTGIVLYRMGGLLKSKPKLEPQ